MDTVLKIQDLKVVYRRGLKGERTALDGLSLEIKAGEILGLLGPNGAGKTTLIKSILGFVNISGGSVELFGKPTDSKDTRRRIGYMPEIANYYWFMTAAEILRLFGRLAGIGGNELKRRVDATLEEVGLAADRNRRVGSFSKGMQSRLNIAQAIIHDPEFLILDEPFSGLDPLGRIDIRNILKAKSSAGKTVMLSSHELSEAELICDTLCIVGRGRALKSGPISVLLEEKGAHSLENYFLKIITGK